MRTKHARLIRQGITLARRPWRLIGIFPGSVTDRLTLRAYWRTRERNLHDWHGKGEAQ